MAAPLKLRRLSPTKGPALSSPDGYEAIKAAERALKADSEDGLELTVEQSLQTIAVELHRANLLKGEELRLQERQIDLVRNGLDGPEREAARVARFLVAGHVRPCSWGENRSIRLRSRPRSSDRLCPSRRAWQAIHDGETLGLAA